MPAGNRQLPPLILDEVVVLGRHPDYPDIEVLLIGSNGEDQAWQTALAYAGVALSSAAARGIENPGGVIVSVRPNPDDPCNYIRVVKALRRLR